MPPPQQITDDSDNRDRCVREDFVRPQGEGANAGLDY